jgi:uncharacterized membrane protein YedE/YeeE
MNYLLYLLSGFIFSMGLCLSGMIDPLKIKSFLAMGTSDWNPALIFVLGSAVPIYGLTFFILNKRKRSLNGQSFKHPAPRPIDQKLVIGSILFGLGWGIAGLCPGPALTLLAGLDKNIFVFLITMFCGFEIQKRFT